MQIWSMRYSRCIHCIQSVFSTVCKCVCHCIHCMHTQSMLYYCCIHCMHCCVRCMHCGCLADQSIASLWLCDLLQHYLLVCRVHLVQLGKGLVVLPYIISTCDMMDSALIHSKHTPSAVVVVSQLVERYLGFALSRQPTHCNQHRAHAQSVTTRWWAYWRTFLCRSAL